MNKIESNMLVMVNGQDLYVQPGTTIAGLLVQLNITQIAVAVELNLQVQPKTTFAERVLRPDDRVEIVSLVGGG